MSHNVINPMEALVKKLEEDLEKLRGSSSGSDVRWAYPFEGTTRVRILPNPKDIAEPFWKIVFRHKIPHPDGREGVRTFVCLRTFGQDCPICALSDALRNSGNEIEKQIGDQIRPITRIYLNAIFKGWRRSDNEQWTTPPGMEWSLDFLKTHPVLLVLPYTAGNALLSMAQQNPIMIDPQRGFDILIVRRRSAQRTEYSVIPIMTPEPIENYDEVIQNAYDLDTVVNERDPLEMMNDVLMGMIGSGHTTPVVLSMAQQWGVNPAGEKTQSIPAPQTPPPITPPKPDYTAIETPPPVEQVTPPAPEPNSVPTPPPVNNPPVETVSPPVNDTPTETTPPPADDPVMRKIEELKKKFSGGG